MHTDNIHTPPGISRFQVEAWSKAIEKQMGESLNGEFTVEVGWSGIGVRLDLPIGVGGFEVSWMRLQSLDSDDLAKYTKHLLTGTVGKIAVSRYVRQ